MCELHGPLATPPPRHVRRLRRARGRGAAQIPPALAAACAGAAGDRLAALARCDSAGRICPAFPWMLRPLFSRPRFRRRPLPDNLSRCRGTARRPGSD